ncbi:MAG: bifunctional UDP-N-acetylglucosamine diphosphorylase/glucosamine-1-phosphate N-acetyltransferase GlmU [Alphaproteobacteria bacterium]|nr:bifunctional UDP-N-acetylglucosamine diphosphorylase/glucosamine-1-phosphate N-acetyltransferase GlmU [Alphaproteobacteria bacterium]
MSELHCIILAAGKGTRMKSDKPKVMAQLAGQPLITHVLNTCIELAPKSITTIIADGMDDVAAAVAPHKTAIQKQQLGTGDAAKAALPALKGAKGHVMVLLGDVPLISSDTLAALHEAATENGLAVLAVHLPDPTGYGRLVTDDNYVTAIVEDRDCTPEQKQITLVNAGCFCIAADKFEKWIGAIKPDNAQKEFYLTDIVKIAADDGVRCEYVEGAEHELRGINSKSQLAEAEGELQNFLRAKAMFDGATLVDPMTVYFSMDTQLGRDVIVEPNVFFGPGVKVADNVTIHAFSHLEGVTIEEGASIGPFARIRPKSHIGRKVTIGNFCEVNRATLKEGAKSKHLSYLGDATIGEKANIGAGTVIANYDGFHKQDTTIGKGVFVGSNSTLVAPVTVGDGAYVGAGSTVTMDVPADALAVARSRNVVRDGWASTYRTKKQAEKAKK